MLSWRGVRGKHLRKVVCHVFQTNRTSCIPLIPYIPALQQTRLLILYCTCHTFNYNSYTLILIFVFFFNNYIQNLNIRAHPLRYIFLNLEGLVCIKTTWLQLAHQFYVWYVMLWRLDRNQAKDRYTTQHSFFALTKHFAVRRFHLLDTSSNLKDCK